MADKTISELVPAEQITSMDMFVLEQNGTAKKLSGQVLLNWLTKAADGHGGIAKIEKLSTSGLVDTYRITLADTSIFDFAVTNGKGISSIKKANSEGLVDTYIISYTDGTSGNFTVTNGEKGPQGDNTYIWIKYASQQPTSASHSFGDLPDNWIGVYFGPLAVAPDDWTQYAWFEIKGKQGDPGIPAVLISATISYAASVSGTIPPSGSWQETIPQVPQGDFLWMRTTYTFNTGDPVTVYIPSRMGLDGLGSVVSVAGISPDATGNVPLTPEDIGAVNANDFNPGRYASARGSAPTLSLIANIITPIVLDTWITRGNEAFSFSEGGIRMPYDGNIMVSASIYNSTKAEDSFGIYIYKNGVEIQSMLMAYPRMGAMGVSPAIVPVEAGDVITLNARHKEGGSCSPVNAATHLDVVYLN